MEKEQLRKIALERRNRIGDKLRKSWSEDITVQVKRLPAFQEATDVLSYSSFRSEVLTDSIHRWCWQMGKRLYLPKTEPIGKTMDFYEVKEYTPLVRGYQGIWEPAGGECFIPEKKSRDTFIFLIMPGAAYDEKGNRIGYGGGYYDRYLARYGEYIDRTVMIAFDVQLVESIPSEQWDIRPQSIIINRR